MAFKAPELKPPREVGGYGIIPELIYALVCGAIGGLLLFVPAFSIQVLCTCCCILLIAAGTVSIAVFFLSGSWKRLNQFGFASGVLLLLLGICGMVKTDALSGMFLVFAGLATLLLGVIMLQDFMQLLVLRSVCRLPALILTVITLALSVSLLMDFTPLLSFYDGMSALTLFLAGTFGLICLIMKAVEVHRRAKLDEKQVPPPEAPQDSELLPEQPPEGPQTP